MYCFSNENFLEALRVENAQLLKEKQKQERENPLNTLPIFEYSDSNCNQ